MPSIFTLLNDTSIGLWKYCLRAIFIAWIPTALISAAAFAIALRLGMSTSEMSGPDVSITMVHFLGTVVFSPVVETWLLGFGVRAISRFVSNSLYVSCISAVIWALLHATTGALRFFGTVWGFFVFSTAYQAWSSRSRREGFLAAAVPHASLNLLAMVALAILNAA